jgi:general secretion pathway protein F
MENGSIEAATRDEASLLLTTRGIFPIEIRRESSVIDRRARLSHHDLALGLHLLATLLRSGLSISRALSALHELVPDSWKRGLPAIEAAVREGKGLATALQSSPLVVPPLVIGLIRAGEAGSGLAEAVERAAELEEERAETIASLRSALVYPSILALAGLASIAILVGVVIPRFAAILDDMGQPLPATTQAVLSLARVARVGALPALLVVALLLIAWKSWTSTSAGGRSWSEFLLALPLIGPLRRSAATGRVCAALSGLLSSGVPIAPALQHASSAVADEAIRLRLLAARDAVARGHRISAAFEEEGVVTPTALQLIRAGEESGQLAGLLGKAAEIEMNAVERRVTASMKLVEPVMILIFGVVVAFVAASLLQAVYSVAPAP